MQRTSLSQLLAMVAVSSNGAIKLGENIVVDGHMENAIVRVVTHIHTDHLVRLNDSIRKLNFIIASPLTHELLEAMGYRIPPNKVLKLPSNMTIDVEGDRLTLVDSNHIPGSVQVHVETSSGLRLGYTGDFKQPGTPVMKDLDVLVIDATYGREEWVRPWQDEVEEILVDIVRDGLAKGPVYVYAYHGKLQEVMMLLRRYGIDAPFIAPYKVYRLTQVMIRHGLPITEVYLDKSRDAQEYLKQGWYVYFQSALQWNREARKNSLRATRILLTGWELEEAYRKIGENEWIVSFSDHADYKQLVEYVEEARPKLLIVDSVRAGQGVAEEFASKIRRKLGIPALSLPPS